MKSTPINYNISNSYINNQQQNNFITLSPKWIKKLPYKYKLSFINSIDNQILTPQNNQVFISAKEKREDIKKYCINKTLSYLLKMKEKINMNNSKINLKSFSEDKIVSSKNKIKLLPLYFHKSKINIKINKKNEIESILKESDSSSSEGFSYYLTEQNTKIKDKNFPNEKFIRKEKFNINGLNYKINKINKRRLISNLNMFDQFDKNLQKIEKNKNSLINIDIDEYPFLKSKINLNIKKNQFMTPLQRKGRNNLNNKENMYCNNTNNNSNYYTKKIFIRNKNNKIMKNAFIDNYLGYNDNLNDNKIFDSPLKTWGDVRNVYGGK